MTTVLSGHDVAGRIRSAFPDAVLEDTPGWAVVDRRRLVEVARFLRDDPEIDGKYLTCVTAVDWIDHFEMVYHVCSLAKNTVFVFRTPVDHENPVVPTLSGVWEGADLQEREAFDLMGVIFEGHPRLKRIFLWEGFPGHPLRKDFMNLPSGFKPGLQRFPFEFKEGRPGYETLTAPARGMPPDSAEEPSPADAPNAEGETGP